MSVFVLNQGLESRTSKSGKQRFTITVKSEPLIFNTDPKTLGAPVAHAIAHHFRERIRGITAIASPATLRARKSAAKAFAAGEAWAVKRYSGGRTGPMAPHQSDRAFNDSGRFASTITANASKDGMWRINVAANRLSGDTTTVERIWNRLVQLVPEFANPAMLMENDLLRRSIEKATRDAIKKAKATSRKLELGVVRQLFSIGRQVGEILAG